MHRIWRRKKEFESFAQTVASDQERDEGRLYSVTAVVETYFELITRALLDKLGRSV
jgi:hypothetical protein